MTARIILVGGKWIDIDEYGTKNLLKVVHDNGLNGLNVVHLADISGKIQYSIPVSSISYIYYDDGTEIC